MQSNKQDKNGNVGLQEIDIIDLHPSTKRRILEHLAEMEYVMWQIKMLLEKAKERKELITRKIKNNKKQSDEKLKKD